MARKLQIFGEFPSTDTSDCVKSVNGMTPDENGNVSVATGSQGEAGKSAYEYAQEAGYEGTEAEFAQKLAAESTAAFYATLSVNADNSYSLDKTFKELLDAYNEGCILYCNIPDEITGEGVVPLALYSYYVADDYEGFSFSIESSGAGGVWSYYASVDADDNVDYESSHYNPTKLPNPNSLTLRIGSKNASYDGSAATYFAVESVKNPNALTINGTAYDGSEAVEMTLDIPTKTSDLSNDSGFITSIPSTLPNPKKLIFTGATSGEYDGSSEITIDIPTGEAEVETILSDNLFDKSTVSTGVFYYGGSGYQIVDESTCRYAFVPLRGAGTYRTKWNYAQHSSSDSGRRVALTKEDNTWAMNVTGVLTENTVTNLYGMEFVVTQEMIDAGAAKIAFDCFVNNLNTVMIVKDREYPDEYIPYGYIEVATDSGKKQNNVLCEKTAVFLGDSICAGTTVGSSSEYYNYGWAGLIGEANKMVWGNYGKNGGTIVPSTSVQEERWLTSQVDAALAAHPKADYVIFEGGCNDADNLGSDGLGTLSNSGYSPSATSTFTEAFETLVLKILNSFPNAKVGYIVAQKMGVFNDYSADSNNYRKYFDRAVEICEKWGIPVLDLWKCNPLNPKLSAHFDSSLDEAGANEAGKFYTDGQHLTLAGYQRITPQIEAFMRSL